jgi:hypothetical protein
MEVCEGLERLPVARHRTRCGRGRRRPYTGHRGYRSRWRGPTWCPTVHADRRAAGTCAPPTAPASRAARSQGASGRGSASPPAASSASAAPTDRLQAGDRARPRRARRRCRSRCPTRSAPAGRPTMRQRESTHASVQRLRSRAPSRVCAPHTNRQRVAEGGLRRHVAVIVAPQVCCRTVKEVLDDGSREHIEG